MRGGLLAALLLGLCPVASQAQDLLAFGDPYMPHEFRLGAYAHDAFSPEKGPVDLNLELLFGQLAVTDDPFWNQWIPRPQLGSTVDFAGRTSNIYAGLAWTHDVWQGLFVEGSLGGAVNDGQTGRHPPYGYNGMGCNASFHETASVGYRLTDAWSVMATIEHYSNAGLCDNNRGLTNYGLRLGYRF